MISTLISLSLDLKYQFNLWFDVEARDNNASGLVGRDGWAGGVRYGMVWITRFWMSDGGMRNE